jgi:hypothetical protein
MHTPYVGGMNFQEINYNNLAKSMQTERICIRYTQVLCNYKGEEHTAGAKCTPAFIYTRTIQNCFTVIVSSPEPNVIVDLNTGQENGGGGGSSGSAEAPEILTEPIYLFNMRPFINQLSNEQKAWWNDPANANAIQNIGIYLQQNQTDEAQEFAKWAIDYLRTNPSVTMAQFQNWFMSPSQGQDFIYDSSFWNNPANLNFQQQSLPSYNDFLDGFPQNGSGEFLTGANNIFSLVGGDVQQVRLDYPGNQTKNVCALKVSIALNNSGVVVPNIPNQTIEGGGDYAGKYFFLNVRALNNWMRATFGTSNPNDGFPDNQNHISFTGQEGGNNGENYPTLAAGLKGTYMLVMPTGSNLSGHADVINNNYCPGNCNFQLPVEHIDIWVLN